MAKPQASPRRGHGFLSQESAQVRSWLYNRSHQGRLHRKSESSKARSHFWFNDLQPSSDDVSGHDEHGFYLLQRKLDLPWHDEQGFYFPWLGWICLVMMSNGSICSKESLIVPRNARKKPWRLKAKLWPLIILTMCTLCFTREVIYCEVQSWFLSTLDMVVLTSLSGGGEMAMACSIITACSGYPPHSRLTTPIKSAHTFYSLKCSINMLHWSSSRYHQERRPLPRRRKAPPGIAINSGGWTIVKQRHLDRGPTKVSEQQRLAAERWLAK